MEGFVSKNTGIKIDHVYKSNDVKDYIRTINIMEIEPGETIRLVFIICLIKKSLKMNYSLSRLFLTKTIKIRIGKYQMKTQ